jgi:sodium/proline symporter
MISEFTAIGLYVLLLLFIGIASYKRGQTATDFIIGGRSMNFWVTALAAHASDMSSWIFMAYPAVIFATGLFNVWTSIGLTLFMFLNWHFIAPKIRTASEKYNSMTFSSYFESRFSDTTGSLRIITAVMLFLYYTIYISAGLQGLGLLIESLFPIPYHLGIMLGLCVVVPYLFIGGYVTLAWTDLFQGIFLLVVITFVPLYILPQVGGIQGIIDGATLKNVSLSLFPSYDLNGFLSVFFIMTSWGLGYFGMPHIVTKFMGIKNVEETYKAKYVGITWQIIALTFSTLIGLIAIPYFIGGISDPQLIFIEMTEHFFPRFFASLILCAILGVTITTMDSQILVLASSLTEDFYKRIIRKRASSKELLLISRLSILVIAVLAYLIAAGKNQSIFALVSYAWFGLGASFGPLMIFSLYSNKINKYGAWAGVLSGGTIAGIWPLLPSYFQIEIPTLIPGFVISSICILFFSYITRHHGEKT